MVPVGSVDLPLTYTADPGADLDGVTVDVPLLLLDQVDSARLDWQVPGLRAELVTALVRALPKDVRRRLGPVPEVTHALLGEVGPADGPLLEVLARTLSWMSGQHVALPKAVLDQLPDHLRVTFRAVDGAGRPIAWSKDLPALRARVRKRQREALAAAAPMAEVLGLRAWSVGTIPRTVEAVHAGSPITGYPALVDEGDAVALRVLPSEAEQRVAMWGGTRRLLLLQLGSPLRTLDAALPNRAKLAIAASSHVEPRRTSTGRARGPPSTSSSSRPAAPCGTRPRSPPSSPR